MKGLIHDESASGQTVYIEPEAVFELNNDIKDLDNAYHRELIRILTALTDQLRPHLPDLRKAYSYLGLLDFIRAKARLAVSLWIAALPVLHNKPLLKWHGVRHPLLQLAFAQHKRDNGDAREVVPLDLELNHEQRILVISGPNAGGKSVSLENGGPRAVYAADGPAHSRAPTTPRPACSRIFSWISATSKAWKTT